MQCLPGLVWWGGAGWDGWWRGLGVERDAVVLAERAAEGSVEECSGVAGGRTLRCECKLVWEDRSWAGPAWLKMLLGVGGWGRGWVGAAKPTLGSLGGNT